jgi:hypothetical protein
LVAQRQHDGKLQALGGWKMTHRQGLTAGHGWAHVMLQDL